MMSENKKTRKRFTNQFKRKILLEYSKGKKPAEIFLENGIDFTADKKYALKLVHKWKQELYKNINWLSLEYCNIDFDYAQKEIDTIGKDSEIDNIPNEILTKNKKNDTP